jgi:hypothetical protein
VQNISWQHIFQHWLSIAFSPFLSVLHLNKFAMSPLSHCIGAKVSNTGPEGTP